MSDDLLSIDSDKLKCPCCGESRMDPKAVCMLLTLQICLGRKLSINSGYRCEKHNAEVGGAQHSQHLQGKAFDLGARDPEEKAWLVPLARKIGFTGFGHGSNFVHIDIGPKREWSY